MKHNGWTDGWMDGQTEKVTKWHNIEVGAPPKKDIYSKTIV